MTKQKGFINGPLHALTMFHLLTLMRIKPLIPYFFLSGRPLHLPMIRSLLLLPLLAIGSLALKVSIGIGDYSPQAFADLLDFELALEESESGYVQCHCVILGVVKFGIESYDLTVYHCVCLGNTSLQSRSFFLLWGPMRCRMS